MSNKTEENKIEENKTEENKIILDDGRPDDFFTKHNVFTRLMIICISMVFVYSFLMPLPIGYIEIISYIMIFALMVITFGLNSLVILGTLIDKWKK